LAFGHHVNEIVKRVANGEAFNGPVVFVFGIDGLSEVRLGECNRYEQSVWFKQFGDLKGENLANG
jgi:hypothetical protein